MATVSDADGNKLLHLHVRAIGNTISWVPVVSTERAMTSAGRPVQVINEWTSNYPKKTLFEIKRSNRYSDDVSWSV